MATIAHVLVPTDGSEGARKAAAFGGDIARAVGARVTILIVQNDAEIISHAWGVGDNPAGGAWGAMSVEQVREMLEKRMREKELPNTAAAIVHKDLKVETALAWGHPADEICRYAAENDVDLIVIGSHGRTGIKRALLGSVSHAVANQAPCPVTIVR